MRKCEIKKIVSTLLVTAALLALGSCGVPATRLDSSAQPTTFSVPENLPVQADPAPAVQPVEKPAEKPAAQPSVSAENPLTKAQAEAIVLNHAGLTAAQVKGLRSEFDIDDGVKEWNVEFRHDGWEYDYEIHAVSGAIRSVDKDWD